MKLRQSLAFLLVGLASATPLQAQNLEKRVQSLAARVQALAHDNQDLRRRLEAYDEELESRELDAVMAKPGQRRFGLGPAASKVYGRTSGVSIGGYGEFLYEQRAGKTDRFDALRSVLYFGYRFDEQWLFNSEIEIEHATTSASSGTTSGEGSVSVEFAAIEFLQDKALNLRAGLLLVPMGLINENHEPTTFLSAQRPETERRIIPSTWRAMGIGAFGDVGGFSYRAYLINSLDGEDFSAAGLRGGRQKGNRAAADDFAGVLRLDYVDIPGLTLGASAYYGKTGQDGLRGSTAIPALGSWIVEAHVDYQRGNFRARALSAIALIDDARQFNNSTGRGLAKRLVGSYVELGYDFMPLLAPSSEVSLTPFVRYERVDTQASLPAGFSADTTQDNEIVTFGVNIQPIDQVVIKLDYEDRDAGDNTFRVLFGYIF